MKGESMNSTRRVLIAASSLALLAACGGGGGAASGGADKGADQGADITVPAASGQNADAGLAPNPNGFAFANFGAAASPEVFGADDLVAMFGSGPDVCVDGATPCKPTAEAAAWAAMVNDNRAAGHCEGFAVLSANRFTAGKNPPSVQLTQDATVTHDIMRAFATQFFQSTQDETVGWQKKSLKDKVATLESALASKKVTYTLAVYTAEGGHAILPYAVEYNGPDEAKIKVYDSNWPGQDRYVLVDLKNEKWTFDYSGANPATDTGENIWTGGAGDLDITSMSARDSASIPFGKGDGTVTKSLLLVRSAALNWSITTPAGQLRPGEAAPSGTSIRPVRSSANKAPGAPVDYMISVDAGQKLEFNLPDPSRVTGITPKAAIRIDTKGSKKGPVTLTDTGVKSDDPSVVLSLADGNLVASSNGAGNEINTTGDQLAVQVTAPNGDPVSVTVTEAAPAVDVRTPGRDGVDANANVEILTQTGDNQIEKKVVDATGKETVTTETGQLDNTQVNRPMPTDLAAPATKPGLPTRDQRVVDPATISAGTTVPTGETSTTIAAATETTVSKPSALPPLRPVATTAPNGG